MMRIETKTLLLLITMGTAMQIDATRVLRTRMHASPSDLASGGGGGGLASGGGGGGLASGGGGETPEEIKAKFAAKYPKMAHLFEEPNFLEIFLDEGEGEIWAECAFKRIGIKKPAKEAVQDATQKANRDLGEMTFGDASEENLRKLYMELVEYVRKKHKTVATKNDGAGCEEGTRPQSLSCRFCQFLSGGTRAAGASDGEEEDHAHTEERSSRPSMSVDRPVHGQPASGISQSSTFGSSGGPSGGDVLPPISEGGSSILPPKPTKLPPAKYGGAIALPPKKGGQSD